MSKDFQEHTLAKKLLETEKQEDKERSNELSSQIRNTISTITLIFSQSQSSTLHSDVEFVNLLIKFIVIVSVIIAMDIYFRYHIITIKTIFGKLFFKVILAVIRIFREFYTYLLATLIRDKISPSISDKEFGSINPMPLIIVLILYLTIIHIITYTLSKSLKLDLKKIRI